MAITEAAHIPEFYSYAQPISGDLWAGPDGSTVHTVKIYPHSSKFVKVKFPNVNYVVATLFPEEELTPDAHTSSRVVQHGVVVSRERASEIFSSLSPNSPHPVLSAKFKVENHTARTVTLPKHTGLFTEYLWNGQTLSGDELADQIITSTTPGGGIGISGEEGKDWMWHLDDEENKDGIIFAINTNPQKRLWLPHDNTPIRINTDKRHNFRQSIDDSFTNFSTRKPDPAEKTLWVGETSSIITLKPWIHAVIPNGPGTSVHVSEYQMTGNDEQQNSPLLIAGRTDWAARLEIKSKTGDDEIPNYIFVQFAQAAKLNVKRNRT